MKQVLIFDVDGTLTGPRRLMYDDFARFFRSIISCFPVYLVTGSDLPKLKEQIPSGILGDVSGAFTCSGNELWKNGRYVYRQRHQFPGEMVQFLENIIEKSPYKNRTGNHLEMRTGTLNASVVGRNASHADRRDYFFFDKDAGERISIQTAIQDQFPDYEANCGGQISVDIAPVGWNKSQVYKRLKQQYGAARYHFFGDNIQAGGNDFPLAQALRADGPVNSVYCVNDYHETWKILQGEFVLNAMRSA